MIYEIPNVEDIPIHHDPNLFHYLDSDFQNLKSLQAEIKGKKVKTIILKDRQTFKEIFSKKYDSLSQGQILEWIKGNLNILDDYVWYFFLVRHADGYSVIRLDRGRKGLYLMLFSILDSNPLKSSSEIKFVVSA